MSTEIKKEIQLEIAHILFIDIVGYSKLSINEEQAVIDELTHIVRSTEQFQKAEAADRLTKIPSGDGMALVFYTDAASASARARTRGRRNPRRKTSKRRFFKRGWSEPATKDLKTAVLQAGVVPRCPRFRFARFRLPFEARDSETLRLCRYSNPPYLF
jgi:hypothetical protein